MTPDNSREEFYLYLEICADLYPDESEFLAGTFSKQFSPSLSSTEDQHFYNEILESLDKFWSAIALPIIRSIIQEKLKNRSELKKGKKSKNSFRFVSLDDADLNRIEEQFKVLSMDRGMDPKEAIKEAREFRDYVESRGIRKIQKFIDSI